MVPGHNRLVSLNGPRSTQVADLGGDQSARQYDGGCREPWLHPGSRLPADGFQGEHPGVTVRSIEVDVDAATSAVAAGVVDIAFGLDYFDAPIPRSRDVALVGLRAERFRMAVSAGRRSKQRTVSLVELQDEGWVLPPATTHYGLAFRMACRRVGFEPRVAHEVTDTATSLAMVAADLAIAPVTDLMLALRSQQISTLPLLEDTSREIVLAHRINPAPQPGTNAVIAVIRRSVATQ